MQAGNHMERTIDPSAYARRGNDLPRVDKPRIAPQARRRLNLAKVIEHLVMSRDFLAGQQAQRTQDSRPTTHRKHDLGRSCSTSSEEHPPELMSLMRLSY